MTAKREKHGGSDSHRDLFSQIIAIIARIVASRAPYLPATERDDFAANYVAEWISGCYRMIKDNEIALRERKRDGDWTASAQAALDLFSALASSIDNQKLLSKDGEILLAFLLNYLQTNMGLYNVRDETHNHWRRFQRHDLRFPLLEDMASRPDSPESIVGHIQQFHQSLSPKGRFERLIDRLGLLIQCFLDLLEKQNPSTDELRIRETTAIFIEAENRLLNITQAAQLNEIPKATFLRRQKELSDHLRSTYGESLFGPL